MRAVPVALLFFVLIPQVGFSQSADQIIDALEFNIESPDAPIPGLLGAAEELIMNGYAVEGEALADLVMAREHTNPEASFLKGWALHEQQRLDEALRWYLRAEENGEDRAGLHFNIGIIRYQQGFYEFALERAQRARSIEPYFDRAWQLEGEAHLALGSYRSAELAFTSVVALDGASATGYIYRGYTRLKIGAFHEAKADFNQAITIDDTNPWTYLYLGEAESELEEFDAALESFSTARQRNAPEPAVLSREGQTYLTAGEHDRALAAIRRASELSPGDMGLLYQLGQAHETIGNDDEAIAVFRRVTEGAPDDPAAYNRIGFLLNGQNRHAEAIMPLQRAIELAPDWSWPINNLANAYVETDRIEEGIELYNRALEVEPDYYVAAQNLARAYYYDLDDVDSAIVAINHAVELYPQSIGSLTLRAEILADTGRNPKQARADLIRAIELHPQSDRAARQLGELDYREGRYRDAVSRLRRARELDPDDRSTIESLAKALRNLGLVTELEVLLDEARSMGLWSDTLGRIAEVTAAIEPCFSGHIRSGGGSIAAPGDAAALTVELYRRYGRLVGSAAVRQDGRFAIPLGSLPGDVHFETWFSDALEREFEIHVRSSLGDGDLLYQRVIGGAELTRFHIIELR